MVEINLLPRKEKKQLNGLVFMVGLTSLLVLSVIALFLYSMSVKSDIQTIETDISSVETERLIKEIELEDTTETTSIEEIEQAIEWVKSQDISTSKLLSFFVSQLPERGYFREYTYVDSGAVQLKIQFDTQREVASYLHQLNESDWVTEATLLTIVVEEISENEEIDPVLPRYVADFAVQMDMYELVTTEGADQ
ncbi:PilN domain-containing protein [Bacillus sp. FJAT-45037]|uniref:PilN domain-containing protein n=1 Tax=Bacillus sp. FJAT-45037 TaxID=2011007 RepID=UPI000C23F172|nr:PilN domain-containing protein [Bacillus sp. FJAT-45037]